MNIVLLTGSPRKNGNTNYLAEQFMRGAQEAGHSVFRFNAAESEVHPCIGCNHCGMNGPCIYNDDFTNILREKIIKSEMVVFCSPMYYFGFSTQLKAVIDRFYAINGTLHSFKKCAMIMAYANTASKDAEAMIAHYHTIASYMGWQDVGKVIAPGIWTAGSIKGSKYCDEAYRLGRSL
ncbi:MAG: flavodoxin family protein [bacterium]|nr:flavodoxin family protein [bacterium]